MVMLLSIEPTEPAKFAEHGSLAPQWPAGVVRSIKEFLPLGRTVDVFDKAHEPVRLSSQRAAFCKEPTSNQALKGNNWALCAAANAKVMRSIESQKLWIANLKPGWDGDDADAFDLNFVDAVTNEIRAAFGALALRPDIVPGADGSIQAEWRIGAFELFYTVEADLDRNLYLRYAGREMSTLSGVAASAALPAMLSLISSGTPNGQTNAPT